LYEHQALLNLTLNNFGLCEDHLDLLERLVLYNEKLEEIDLDDNSLARLKGFFKNL